MRFTEAPLFHHGLDPSSGPRVSNGRDAMGHEQTVLVVQVPRAGPVAVGTKVHVHVHEAGHHVHPGRVQDEVGLDRVPSSASGVHRITEDHVYDAPIFDHDVDGPFGRHRTV